MALPTLLLLALTCSYVSTRATALPQDAITPDVIPPSPSCLVPASDSDYYYDYDTDSEWDVEDMDKVNQASVREINRKLLQTVRSDWDFPNPPLQDKSNSAVPEPLSYRERYYGTTDDSASDDEYGPGIHRVHTIEDMYAFDSPDSVGDELDRKLQERKKRKRKALEEELENNEGLCYFLRQRNAWTGAIAREPTDKPKPSESPAAAPPQKLSTSSDSSPADTPTSSSSKTSASASAARPISTANYTSEATTSSNPSPFHCPSLPDTLTDVLIPLATPIIPSTHPVRLTISSRSQSELYDKVVRDTRTPAVPINLAEMTRIIVQGWKDEGNWPPKGSAPEPAIAGRRVGGGSRVAKMVGLRDDRDDTAGGGILAHHPHLSRGVEGVKRVFRLSGSNHHGSDSPREGGVKSPKFGGFGGGHSRSNSHEL